MYEFFLYWKIPSKEILQEETKNKYDGKNIWKILLSMKMNVLECNDDLENVENGRKLDRDKSGFRTWIVWDGKRIRCA